MSVEPIVSDNADVSRSLETEDLSFLTRSGISADVARTHAFSVYSMDGRKGIQFRWTNFDGDEIHQFRPANPRQGEPKYRFKEGESCAFNVLRWTKGVKRTLVVEGTKQSLSALSYAPEGWNILGTAGCWGWKKDGKPSPDLHRLMGHDVVVVFDGDARTNEFVWEAAASLRSELRNIGRGTRFSYVHLGDYSDTPRAGLDDVLSQVDENQRTALIVKMTANAGKLGPNPDGTLPGEYTGSDILKPTKKGGFQMQTAITAVREFGAIATDEALELWWYTDAGVWKNDGRREVTRRMSILLGERFRPDFATSVVKTIQGEHPTLTDDAINTALINTPSGLLAWETGELHPHTPDEWVPAQIPVEWDPEARCPEIDKFLHSVLDEESVPFFYEIAGYCLLNDYPIHQFIAFSGTGRNGKGTAMNLLVNLVGKRNVSATSPQLLDSNRFRAAELYGKLANMCGDVDPKIFAATETFKKATGGDLVEAERKNGQPFRFYNRATMIGAFNELPQTADNTVGFYDRWLVVPFERYIRPEDRDPNLSEKLTRESEMRGFLVKAVEGLQRLMKRGHFDVPTKVREASEQFRMNTDHVRGFLASGLRYNEDAKMSPDDLYAAYREFVLREGGQPKKKRRFLQEFQTAVPESLGMAMDEVKTRTSSGYRYHLAKANQNTNTDAFEV